MNLLEERIKQSLHFKKLPKRKQKSVLRKEIQMRIRDACIFINYIGFDNWIAQCGLPDHIIEITRDVMKTDPGLNPAYRMAPLLVWLPKIKIRMLRNKLKKMDLTLDQTACGLIESFIDSN